MARAARVSDSAAEIIVIGAGIAGLAAAWRLGGAGIDVRVLEAAPRAGGLIETERRGPFLVEWGPHSFLHNAAHVVALARDLGLADRIVLARPRARRRYIYSRGKLRRVPAGPLSLLFGTLLSPRARLRALREPWVARGASAGAAAESAYDFFARRFGGEFAERIAAPFASGVYAGDLTALEAGTAFSRAVAWEREHGSVLRGALREWRARSGTGAAARPRGSYSFQDGMGELGAALAAALGDRLECGAAVHAIERAGSGWWIRAHGLSGDATWHARGVAIALPAHRAAEILAPAVPAAAAALAEIPYAPIAVAQFGVRNEMLTRPLDGFGFLTIAREGPPILGCLWPSAIFEGRAPEGVSLLTVFLGGVRDAEIRAATEGAVIERARRGLAPMLLREDAPVEFAAARVLPRAIPQLVVGHTARHDRLSGIASGLGTIAFAGNFLGGVSVEDAVRSGLQAAEALLVGVREPGR
ncbi:MAG: protoporphyrinogen oxidase [Planctomycetes bacterium]|nr:protoporphyrinogen oxidase [Planctomycetota bacterium]